MSIYSQFPNQLPTVSHNFAKTKRLDSNFTFSRASTGTYVDSDGLIKTASVGAPRFDHDPVTGECKGLLVEESKTNLVINSTSITLPWWNIPSGAFVDLNSHLAPDGTITAFKYRPGAFFARWVSNAPGQRFGLGTSGIVYTLSMYLKAGEITSARFDIVGTSIGNGGAYIVNLSTGQITGVGSNVLQSGIKPVGNGWYYCFVTAPVTQNVGAQDVQIFRGQSVTDLENDGYYGWGFQLEVGSAPTSYIPTSGSQITRSADILSPYPLKDFKSSRIIFTPSPSNSLNSIVPSIVIKDNQSTPEYAIEISSPNKVPTVTTKFNNLVQSTASFVRPATAPDEINLGINYEKETGKISVCTNVTDETNSSVVTVPQTCNLKLPSGYTLNQLEIKSNCTIKSIYNWNTTATTDNLVAFTEKSLAKNNTEKQISGFIDELYDKADPINNGKPSLDLNFAKNKSLIDDVSNSNLITFSRASTGTYVDADGLIKTAAINEPRFDHDPVTGECKGLLVEESRTNLFSNSNPWSGGAGVTWSSGEISPTGDNNAFKMVEDNSSGIHGISIHSGGYTANYNVTFSVFAKAAGNRFLSFFAELGGYPGVDAPEAIFDIQNGTVVSVSNAAAGMFTNGRPATIINYGNGWYRCIVHVNPTSLANRTMYILMSNSSATNARSYTGNGSSGILLFGLQRESGSFETSYIPTSSSSITRSADTASITGSNFIPINYNQLAGTAFFSGAPFFNNTTNTWRSYFAFTDGTTNGLDGLRPQHFSNTSIQIPANVYAGEYILTINAPTPVNGTASKFAVNHQKNVGIAACFNGGSIGSRSTNEPYSRTMDRLIIAGAGYLGSRYNGIISRLTYWPTRLPNAILQSITSQTITNWSFEINTSLLTDGIFAIITTGTVTYTVDWNDGSALETVVASGTFTRTHAYTLPKNYVITITVVSGTFRPFWNGSSFARAITKLRVTPSGSWGGFGTTLSGSFTGSSNLTEIAVINTITVTDFNTAWRDCTSLTRFPPISLAAGTSFSETWRNCSTLSVFPAAMFDTRTVTNYVNTFTACALSASSIENILVSINAANTSNGSLGIGGGSNAGQSTWTTQAVNAYNSLVSRGWTITFNA